MYLARPEEGAHNLLDEPFGLGFAPIMYDSEPDVGHHAIYFGSVPSTIVTKHGHPKIPSLHDQLTLDEEGA